jgi:hypothetical protein
LITSWTGEQGRRSLPARSCPDCEPNCYLNTLCAFYGSDKTKRNVIDYKISAHLMNDRG